MYELYKLLVRVIQPTAKGAGTTKSKLQTHSWSPNLSFARCDLEFASLQR